MSGIKKVLVIVGIAIVCAVMWITKGIFSKDGSAPDYACCPADDPEYGGDGNIESDNIKDDSSNTEPISDDSDVDINSIDNSNINYDVSSIS